MDQDPTLVLVRGSSGSGKSTYARQLTSSNFAADDFFEARGEFDGSLLADAHCSCQLRVGKALRQGEPLIVVHNTFVRLWEMQPYLDMAQTHGYAVRVVHVCSGLSPEQLSARNVHGVPVETIRSQIQRFEPFEGEEVYHGESSCSTHRYSREGR